MGYRHIYKIHACYCEGYRGYSNSDALSFDGTSSNHGPRKPGVPMQRTGLDVEKPSKLLSNYEELKVRRAVAFGPLYGSLSHKEDLGLFGYKEDRPYIPHSFGSLLDDPDLQSLQHLGTVKTSQRDLGTRKVFTTSPPMIFRSNRHGSVTSTVDNDHDAVVHNRDNDGRGMGGGTIQRTTERARQKFQSMQDHTSDVVQRVKTDKKPLCSVCCKIPFKECLPRSDDELSGQDDEDTQQTKEITQFTHVINLTHILNNTWCKMCGLLYKSVCQPEYDLFQAEHIKSRLGDSDKLRDIKSFSAWVEQYSYFERKRMSADVWPFGYAIDQQQSMKSTMEQAETLFSQAEESDIDTKCLSNIRDMYQDGEIVETTTKLAHGGMGILSLTKAGNSEEARRAMAGVQMVTSHLAMLSSSWSKRLPCLFVVRAYKPDVDKAGALSVRVYGHGRAPLAPLKEITHFSLRFEGSDNVRTLKQQIWYGRKLLDTIDLTFFETCVERCKALHKHCWDPQWKTPTQMGDNPCFRLIDVRDKCLVRQNFEDVIKPDSHPGHLNYVALSYRWGNAPRDFTQLDIDNEETLMNKQGLKSEGVRIPRTIVDAILVTKGTGQRYLWVDSLCVMQDHDSADNKGNIARMGRIYNHALFTIVAGDSDHADKGIEGVRKNFSSIRKNSIKEKNVTEEIHGAQIRLPISIKFNLEKWEDRAWCFQEKVLSRRMLVLADGFAVWHCRGGVWREDVNALDGDKSSVSFSWPRLTSSSSTGKTAIDETAVTKEEDGSVRLTRTPAMTQYIEAVEDFSKRAMSKGGEVLDAFEGLQKILAYPELLGSPFRMGLPVNFLELALLWQSNEQLCRRTAHVDQKGNTVRPPPAWTWAGWRSIKVETNSFHGAPVRYSEPFHVNADEFGLHQRIVKLPLEGEERIRPARKGMFFGVRVNANNTRNLLEYGVSRSATMNAKEIESWSYWSRGPAKRPNLGGWISELDERHLVVNTEAANLHLGRTCWRIKIYTNIDGTEYCREVFQDSRLDRNKTALSDTVVKIIETEECHITIGNRDVGIVKFDEGICSINAVKAIILSEAQYLGDEVDVDVLSYPFYNIMLIRQARGSRFWERFGLGKMRKFAWKQADPRSEIVVLE